MRRGILLIAAGHENYYRMALNCAVSIKATSGLPVALAHAEDLGQHYTEQELSYFDERIRIEDQYFIKDGVRNFSLLKISMYWLSPFEETLYMDCDSLALYTLPLESLFESASRFPIQFDIQEEELVFSHDQEWDYFWFNEKMGGLKKIREVYDIPKSQPIYMMQSSLLYFQKLPPVEAFFKTALQCFQEDKLGLNEGWDGWLLDELMFMIAQGIHGLEMQVPFKKVYYPYLDLYLHSDWQLEKILSDYYFYSIPGLTIHHHFINLYNELIAEYFRHEGLDTSRMFLYQNKKEYAPERVSL